jgi:hypothetical protein
MQQNPEVVALGLEQNYTLSSFGETTKTEREVSLSTLKCLKLNILHANTAENVPDITSGAEC